MGGFEFMMLVCFGFSWPFSILKSIRSRSTKGKSLVFMLLVLCGYIFGLIHKLLYSRDWVIWAYATAMLLVVIDLLLYVRNWYGERKAVRNGVSSTSEVHVTDCSARR